MSKRKSQEEEPDPEGPWANKQFHPTKSSYSDYRQNLLRMAAVSRVGGPPVRRSETQGPMEQFNIHVQLRDPKPLLELVRNYRFKDYQLEILLAQSLHANLLEVVGQILAKMPALLNEQLVEYAVRTREVAVLSVSFLLSLLAEKNSTTVEQTAQGALKRLGQDQLILDQAKMAKLKELARKGAPADPRKEEEKEKQRHPGELVPAFEHEVDGGEVSHVQFTPDGRYLAFSTYNQEIKVYDWRANRLERTLDFSIGGDDVSMFTFSPDGRTMYAACHNDGRIMACRMDEQKAERNLEVKDWGYPYHMTVSHDGKLLAVGCDGSRVTLVDTAQWSLVQQITLPGHSTVTSVCFSLDDRQLFATISSSGAVYAIDTATWVRRDLIQNGGDVYSMVCSPTRPWLVGVGSNTSFLWYYNYETGETGEATFSELNESRCNVRFTSNGKYVVVAARDGEVTILDTEDGWKQVYHVETERGAFHFDASASSFGVIATCNRDTVRVFDLKGLERAHESLGSAVSSGLANWGQPQSAWDMFLSHPLRDARLFLFANQFLTGARHCSPF